MMRRMHVGRLFVAAFLLTAMAIPAVAYNNGDVPVNTPESARRMIEDLVNSFGNRYPGGADFLKRLDEIDAALAENANDGDAKNSLQELIREAALANPLLDIDQLLVIRRKGEANRSLNSYTNMTIKRKGWDNEISVLKNLTGEVKCETIYRSPDQGVMKQIEVNYDANRIMFSGVGQNGQWAIMEVGTDGKNLVELTPDDQKDINWFDSCYLPQKDYIVTCSTAGIQGLPCVNGGQQMVNLYRVNTKTKEVRQLTFEQDSDWHPRVLQNGRVMYLRWEYTDTPHYFTRILFQMNPDGTGQMELWGSGSYFPTAFCWARQCPDNPNNIVGTVSGHHAKSETGRLMIVNPSLGRKYPMRYRPESKEWGPERSTINIHPDVLPAEETGCVQEIPGWGRDVVGNVYDNQGGGQKYTFQTPWPLSSNYYLVSMKGCPGASGKWNICLVDVFDNMIPIYQDKDYDCFEPMPLAASKQPPTLPDRTIKDQPCTIFCTDVYGGRGLKNIPRGKVKALRVFAYHYGYWGAGGHESVGLETGWDIKRILGTVPVEEDGSFCFQAPPNTPIAIHPLDENGASLAVMRSWMVGMQGERLACNGCHEDQNEVTPNVRTIAGTQPPREIDPWYGPTRPFAFHTEVQPVLDRYCLECHTEAKKDAKRGVAFEKTDPNNWRNDRSYLNLVAFTHRGGPEDDLDLLKPMEYHVSTSWLVQMLRKGHYGVKLDAEAWDRINTWIDLGAPHRGGWSKSREEQRRLDLAILYAGLTDNPEEEFRMQLASLTGREAIEPVKPEKYEKPKPDGLKAKSFPFSPRKGEEMEVELAEGVTMKLVKIPAGEFVMGSQAGYQDEMPRAVVRVDKPFWMATTETTNAQYEAFDPSHDTRYIDETGKDHAVPGYIANHLDQPAARISWQEAQKFCAWLAKKTGKSVKLPTEAQWEWAARAGSEKQFHYGDENTDFSKWANLADAGLRKTYVKWDGGSKVHERREYPADYLYPLRDDRFTDNWFVVDYVAQCEANGFGLFDMVGNVSEWTRSDYRAYPYDDRQANGGRAEVKKVARGGSWADRPRDAGSTVRLPYESYQKVYNVGFRVIIE